MTRALAALVFLVLAFVLALELSEPPARAGGQSISPNLLSCVPLPSQAGIPGTIDGSSWMVLTSGANTATPGLLCIGADYRPYVLACRLGAGGCVSPPTFVAVGGAWPTAWP